MSQKSPVLQLRPKKISLFPTLTQFQKAQKTDNRLPKQSVPDSHPHTVPPLSQASATLTWQFQLQRAAPQKPADPLYPAQDPLQLFIVRTSPPEQTVPGVWQGLEHLILPLPQGLQVAGWGPLRVTARISGGAEQTKRRLATEGLEALGGLHDSSSWGVCPPSLCVLSPAAQPCTLG